MPNSKGRFIIAEFYDGIQVIPHIWLTDKNLCKYPSHYKTDLRVRKAVEKEEVPTSNWSTIKIKRIFGEYSSLLKADEKAKQSLDTSDMDTDKEAKKKRKFRARKDVSSSESEKESSTEDDLPPPPNPPKKRARLCDEKELASSSITRSEDSAKKYSKSRKASQSNWSGSGSQVDENISQDTRNEERRNSDTDEGHNSDTVDLRKENEENINEMEEISHVQGEESSSKKKRNELNDKSSQDAIVDHLKRLTRDVKIVKHDMRQTLNLIDILINQTSTEKEAEKRNISFENVECRFPLQTAEQLLEVEEILQHRDSQHKAEIRDYVKSIGGINVTDAVKRTLYKLFSNKLAENYNWEGRRGKEPLRNLKLIKVIFSCILQNIRKSDHGKIQRRIMEWFRHAKARRINEDKRNNPQQNDNDNRDNASAE